MAQNIRKLSDTEARALLTRGHVGRFAYAHNGDVDIEAITYACDGEWIFGRMGIGVKFTSLALHPACAFEVDEVAGPFSWQSVVVKGTFHILNPADGAPPLYAQAIESIRALAPAAFTVDDPASDRTSVFGVRINSVTGRASGDALGSSTLHAS